MLFSGGDLGSGMTFNSVSDFRAVSIDSTVDEIDSLLLLGLSFFMDDDSRDSVEFNDVCS